jgi:CRP-like cAMP-binding protein
VRVQEAAQFLAHSNVGNNLNLAQRTRVAGQCKRLVFRQGEPIVRADEAGQDLYIIRSGTVEVWKDRETFEAAKTGKGEKPIDTVRPGQITGEFAMLDQGARSADLIAGRDGAVILSLHRERLLALCEDDAVLGTTLLWNIATAVSRRVRFILWQLNRAEQKRAGAATDDIAMTMIGKAPPFVQGGKYPR